MELVATEEEATEYLEQLTNFTKFFFFSGRKISEIGMFACDEIQSFHNKNRENKRYDRMCLLSVYFRTNGLASAHKIVSVYRS